MTEGPRRIVADPVRPDTWAPFGWIPRADTDPADGQERLTYQWDDAHVNVISHAPDEVVRDRDGLHCDRMYRHDTHTQVLLALNGPSVLAVAPADADLGTAARTGRGAGLPAGEARRHRAAPWHVALGAVPPRGRARAALQRAGVGLRRATTPRPTWRPTASTWWWWSTPEHLRCPRQQAAERTDVAGGVATDRAPSAACWTPGRRAGGRGASCHAPTRRRSPAILSPCAWRASRSAAEARTRPAGSGGGTPMAASHGAAMRS